MSKQKLWVVTLLTVVVLVLGTGVALAYLADGDEKMNPFSIGSNTITPEEEFEKPEPGKKTVKTPVASNIGTVACYVRAKVLLSDSRAKPFILFYENDNEGMNGKDWTEGDEGWLYYKSSIKPEEKTTAVFTHIKLLQTLPADLKDVSVDVVFESVQSEGFKDAQSAFTSIDGRQEGAGNEGN